MFISNIRDIFKCPYCGTYVAHGDNFCKGCGVKFTKEDVAKMKNTDKKGMWNGHTVGLIFFGVVIVLFLVVASLSE